MQAECSSTRGESLNPDDFEEDAFVRSEDDEEYDEDEYYDYYDEEEGVASRGT